MAYRVTAGYVTVQTRVGRGRAYIDLRRGDTLPADVPAAEVQRLLRARQVEDTSMADGLDTLDKDGLVARAAAAGVPIDRRWRADRIAAAIRDHPQ